MHFFGSLVFLLNIPRVPHDYDSRSVADLLDLDSLVNRRGALKPKFPYGLLCGKVVSPYILSLFNFKIYQRHTRSYASFFITICIINYLYN